MTDPTQDPTKTQPRGQATPIGVREPSRETKLERARYRRITGVWPYVAAASVVIGFMPIAAEFYRYYRSDRPLNAWPILIGGAFMLIGAFMLNHKDTLNVAQFMITNGIAIVQAVPSGIGNAIRGGRRTDPPGTIVETTVTPPPANDPPPSHPSHEG